MFLGGTWRQWRARAGWGEKNNCRFGETEAKPLPQVFHPSQRRQPCGAAMRAPLGDAAPSSARPGNAASPAGTGSLTGLSWRGLGGCRGTARSPGAAHPLLDRERSARPFRSPQGGAFARRMGRAGAEAPRVPAVPGGGAGCERDVPCPSGTPVLSPPAGRDPPAGAAARRGAGRALFRAPSCLLPACCLPACCLTSDFFPLP